jgi:hypothetical protein
MALGIGLCHGTRMAVTWHWHSPGLRGVLQTALRLHVRAERSEAPPTKYEYMYATAPVTWDRDLGSLRSPPVTAGHARRSSRDTCCE